MNYPIERGDGLIFMVYVNQQDVENLRIKLKLGKGDQPNHDNSAVCL
jgi:hypothetical protein